MVIDSGNEGYDFFINMDNVYLLSEQKSNSKINPKLLDARYKYSMVLLGIALIKDNETIDISKESENDNGSNIYEKISYFTRAVSPILLPMISGLGDLQEDEINSGYEEE